MIIGKVNRAQAPKICIIPYNFSALMYLSAIIPVSAGINIAEKQNDLILVLDLPKITPCRLQLNDREVLKCGAIDLLGIGECRYRSLETSYKQHGQ